MPRLFPFCLNASMNIMPRQASVSDCASEAQHPAGILCTSRTLAAAAIRQARRQSRPPGYGSLCRVGLDGFVSVMHPASPGGLVFDLSELTHLLC